MIIFDNEENQDLFWFPETSTILISCENPDQGEVLLENTLPKLEGAYNFGIFGSSKCRILQKLILNSDALGLKVIRLYVS